VAFVSYHLKRVSKYAKNKARNSRDKFVLNLFGKPVNSKFIILTSHRSGSTWLRSLLSKHKNITMGSELFNLYAIEPAELDRLLLNPPLYLESFLLQKQLPKIETIGFKIFYTQATKVQLLPEYYSALGLKEPGDVMTNRITPLQDYINQNFDKENIIKSFEEVWSKLIDDKELKVIHLKRRNKLKQLVSLRKAWMSDEWIHRKHDAGKDLDSFSLSYEECLDFFELYTSREREFDKKFGHHQMLSLYYEDFIRDKENRLLEIQKFLGVPLRSNLVSSLRKQNTKPISASISNYEELQKAFRASKWESFFN